MTFKELLKSLTLGELLSMIIELRQFPEDKQHLNWALQELGSRQKEQE